MTTNMIQNAISNNKLIVIAGPTASGKTAFAIELAKKYNGELINADSRQVYRELPIGTNVGNISNEGEEKKLETNYIDSSGEEVTETLKIPVHSIDGVPIHLLQFRNPNEGFDVARFKRYAEFLIQDISKRDKVAIVVGGTGLYIDALLKKSYVFKGEEIDLVARNELNNKSRDELQALVKQENSKKWDSLNNSDKNNPVRLIRILEKTRSNAFTDIENNEMIDYLMFYPEYDWNELSKKIEKRAYKMFDEGLVAETEAALKKYGEDAIALQGIGYREVILYLHNKLTLEEAKQKLARSHIQYARRQRIWFESAGRNYKLKKVSFANG